MNIPQFLRAILVGCSLFTLALPAWADEGGWKETSKQDGLTIYEREHAGTSVKEVRAIGNFSSPNWMVRNVLDDAEHYPEFMPHVTASRIISRDPAKRSVTAYAELNPPVVSRRDYAITIHDESRPGPGDEMTYVSRWEGSNKGPAEKSGVVRVKNNEGSWLLEPTDGGAHTRGTYTLFTDGGGGIPAFLLNSLNKKRLTDLFEAVGKRVQEKQYRQTKPVLP